MPLISSRRTPARPNSILLTDSSAWVEYLRATGSRADLRIRELIDSDLLAVTQPVIMEICAGVKQDGQERKLRNMLLRYRLLHFDAQLDFDLAVRVYRDCRAAGITPRGLIDCMIAAVALRNDVALLACDRDLVAIAGVVNIPLDRASLPGSGTQ